MSKNSSTLFKDALILFAISLVLAMALGFTYEITKAPILKQQQEKKAKAYKGVFAELEETATTEELLKAAANYSNKKGITIDEALLVIDANKEIRGYVMTITNSNGYGGNITITMGYSMEKVVTGIEFLTLKETAGLGMKAKEAAFKEQFSMKEAGSFAVYKNGTPITAGEARVDVISSATITTKAITDAVNAGIEFASEQIGGKVK